MNQKERNELSRARILVHASAEFAEHGYHGASVNRICEKGKISKGLMYHYYKDRDDLYLACVKQCFSEITKFILKELDKDSITVDEYFDRRTTYFEEHPVYYYLYMDFLTNLCPHIQEAIRLAFEEYDALLYRIFCKIVKNQYPGKDIDLDFTFKMIKIMRLGVNSYIEKRKPEILKPAEHAELCRQAVNTVFHGVL